MALAFVLVGSAPSQPLESAAPSPLFVRPSGSDEGRCTRTNPCASFDRAFQLARPGTVVRVGAGTYGPQTIDPMPGKRSPRVIFQPAADAKVVVRGELTIRGSHLGFRRMTLYDVELPRQANDVVFRDITNHGIWMQGASNVSFLGGQISCGVCGFHSHLDDGGPPDFRPPRNILFDRVFFHDWQAATPDQHTECLQILSGDGITIRNSVFRDCATANGGRGATANLHVSWFGSGPKTRNVLIENNFFYRSGNTYAIQTGDFANLRLRYNSIVGPILVFGGYGNGSPVELVGNVMRFSNCKASPSGSGPVAPLRYRRNVLDGGTCGSGDVNGPAGFIDPRTNLHLRRNAVAINRGDRTSYPRRDIDGSKRPKGGRPDAGADEVR